MDAHDHREDRPRRGPLAERPRPRPHPAARSTPCAGARASCSTRTGSRAPRPTDLEGFDGIWVVPGSPYRDPEKVVAAIGTAREHEIPFLGTCGGFQHAILHLARDLAGIEDAHHAEYGLTETDVIVQLECSLVGHEGPITYAPDTLMARIAGVERSLERYHCAYGISPSYVEVLEQRRRDLRRPRRRRRAARAGTRRTTRSSSARSSSPSWPATAPARTP